MRAREIVFRPMQATDYDAVVALWRATEGVEVAEGDSVDDFAAYLERNPGLSRVACRDGVIIGAVLCGHDGRRGLLYHLAVAHPERGRGIGRQLVAECLAALRRSGLKRVLILVARDNVGGLAFWQAEGFTEIELAVPLGRDL